MKCHRVGCSVEVRFTKDRIPVYIERGEKRIGFCTTRCWDEHQLAQHVASGGTVSGYYRQKFERFQRYLIESGIVPGQEPIFTFEEELEEEQAAVA